MPIRIADPPEPQSRSATTGLRGTVLIESEAYRLLKEEARRYLDGEISGRSFLISGHRGSGKTTLVMSVCDELLRECSGGPLRPLPVLLHGPNLLPYRENPKPENSPEPAQGEEAGGKGKAELLNPLGDDAQNALVQITLGLFRTLASEFSRTYGEAIDRSPYLQSARARAEGRELAAQFELELDRCPEPSRLREFWERPGFLERGVLFGPNTGVRHDQGFRELLALASASEMYRRISGTATRKEEEKAGAEKKESVGAEVSNQGKDLVSPIVSIATGGLAGVGLLTQGTGALGAAAAGLVAALGAASVFRLSASRSRESRVTRESTYIRDMTVKTLDRELPVLIERTRAAGLVPLFVVDELDKVVDLLERTTDLIRRLKQLVGERAFFCFLTDRSYFEQMRQKVSSQAYPIEYTYFSDRLFIVYPPESLHRYLNSVLVLEGSPVGEPLGPAPPSQPVETAAMAGLKGIEALALKLLLRQQSRSGAHPQAQPVDLGVQTALRAAVAYRDTQVAEERADLVLFPYVLLHQARMHAIDVRRALAELRGVDGRIDLRGKSLRSSRARLCDLLIQLAIEMILDREAMREVLEQEPPFRQVAHDALYYPSSQWAADHEGLKLGESAKPKFREYLVGRMKSFEKRDVATPKDTAPEEAAASPAVVGSEPRSDPSESKLSTKRSDFLFDQVKALCVLLSDRKAFEQELKRWQARAAEREGRTPRSEDRRLTWATVQSIVAPAKEEGRIAAFPLLDRAGKDRYLWRFNRAGLPLFKTELPPKSKETKADLAEQVGLLRGFSTFLAEFSR